MSDPLPDELRRRLARRLDSVPLASPRPEQARYRRRQPAPRPPLLPRLALGFAAGAIAVLLAGILTTGSANPAVWTTRLEAVIRAVEPGATPTPAEPSTAPVPRRGAPASPGKGSPQRGDSPGSGHGQSPEPSQRPRPSTTPRSSSRPTSTE